MMTLSEDDDAHDHSIRSRVKETRDTVGRGGGGGTEGSLGLGLWTRREPKILYLQATTSLFQRTGWIE